MRNFIKTHWEISAILGIIILTAVVVLIRTPGASSPQPVEFKAWRSTLSTADSHKASKLYDDATESVNKANKCLATSQTIEDKVYSGELSQEAEDQAFKDWDKSDKEAHDWILRAQEDVAEIRAMGYTGDL